MSTHPLIVPAPLFTVTADRAGLIYIRVRLRDGVVVERTLSVWPGPNTFQIIQSGGNPT